MPRKKAKPVDQQTKRAIGGLLRGLRRTAGYRAVRDAAHASGAPAAQQTIYAYERGGLLPTMRQFLELVEFYALETEDVPDTIRPMAAAAVVQALMSPAYGLPDAFGLVRRLQTLPPDKP